MNAPVVVEVPKKDGTILRLRSDANEEATRRLLRMRRRTDVRNDVFVAHHVPADAAGRDFFADMRAVNAGAFWNVGSTMFETDRIPATWVGPCNRMDEIWVPTRFNVETFGASGVDRGKLRAMPFGVAPLRDGDVDRDVVVGTTKTFKFLSVFELTKRKGWDVLLRAWLEAFRPEDDVALVVKTYGRKGVKPLDVFARFIASLGRDPEAIPEIVLMEERLSDAQMRGLFAACDAFVLPSRGEGWGMPYLEAQQQGLPVVATRWSGQLEFLHDDNAFLVDVARLAPVDAEQVKDDPIYAGHLWAEPSVASCVDALRRVVSDVPERRRRAARGAAEAATTWTAERAAARIAARLREIEKVRVACAPPRQVGAVADVEWSAPFYSPSGYGSEARAFVRALAADGAAPKLKPVAWDAAVADLSRDDVALLHHLAHLPTAARRIVVRHAFASDGARGPEPVAVLRTMFETDRIPADWVAPCAASDEVWVPSEHNRATFAASGVPADRLRVVPGTIDMDAFAPEGPALPLRRPGVFTFLSVFEWSPRKAPDLLVRAFVEEFSGRDDVALVLRTAPPAGAPRDACERLLARATDAARKKGRSLPPIRLFDGILKDEDLPALYRGADAFVLPTRGEGFGRPFLEAAATGLPVIATRWGGQLDLLDDAFAFLVDARLADVPESALAALPRFRGHRWAEPDLSSLRANLRAVVADPAGARARGLRGAASVRRTHAPAVVASLVASRLAALRARL